MNKNLIIIIAVVLILVGGFLGWQKLNSKSETLNSKQTQNTEIQNETADWKTYTNDEYGFLLQYPPYLTMGQNGRPGSGINLENNDNNINVSFIRFGLNESIKGPILFNTSDIPEKSDNYERGGVVRVLNNPQIINEEYYTYETVGWPSYIPDVTTIIKNGDFSLILDVYGQREIDIEKLKRGDYSEYADLEKLNNQILSTFKFTNSKSQTPDWRTYKNDENLSIL